MLPLPLSALRLPFSSISLPLLSLTAGLLWLAGCGSADEPPLPFSPGAGGVSGVAPSDPPAMLRTPAAGTPIDRAGKNSIFVCPRGPVPLKPPPLTRASNPWIEGDAVLASKMPYVEGSVSLKSEFSATITDAGRVLKGNGIPNHPIGAFPVQPGTAAYPYYAALPAEGYSSAAEIPVEPYVIDVTLPLDPQVNAEPTCVASIVTGVVTQTGGVWHLDIAPDQMLRLYDPIAALPVDQCWGHPYAKQYHYHGYSWKCFPDQGTEGEHSPLFGYAMDGFGVFGPRGEGGKLVDNDDLDECHGHTHEIPWDGKTKEMYHYHVNNQYPYSIGCYRGTPVELPHNLQH